MKRRFVHSCLQQALHISYHLPPRRSRQPARRAAFSDLREFQRLHAEAKTRGEKIGASVVLKPGDWLELED